MPTKLLQARPVLLTGELSVRDAMEQFLREHGVEEQAFYHGALVGTHINRMLTHHPSILLGIESVMRNTTLRRPDPWADGSTY